MSNDDFLSRWSRRKLESEKSTNAEPAISRSGEPDQAVEPETLPKSNLDEEGVDLASLPPIDSLTAASDVTAFLRKGVPLELTRAALRRVWVADPAIRDFKGLAENAWDFTDPTAMPGFGALDQSADEVRRLASQVFGDVKDAVEELAEATDRPASTQSEAGHDDLRSPTPNNVAGQNDASTTHATLPGIQDNSSPQDVAMQQEEKFVRRRRGHGGALPT